MSEQDIDRVLAALGSVEAPRGLEQRVLARMAQAEKLPRGWLIGRGWLLSVGGLATAVLVVGIVVGHQPRPVVVPAPAASRVAAAPVAAGEPVRAASVGRKAVLVRRVKFVRAEVTEAAGGGEDAVAMAEMLAPSHPAPPMPLTAGEKRLMRASRQPESVELARVEARSLAMRSEEERAFQAYFVHPPLLVTPAMTNNP